MVPKGWMLKQLSDIVKEKISYGIVQAGPHIPNGIPYIKSSDIRGAIDPASLQRTAPEIHYKYRRSAVHPGDIIFSLRGNIGETSIVPSNLLEANLTQGTARISVSSDQCNEFYHQQFAMDKLRNYINSLSKGSTFKEISLEELRKVKVLCAPLPEQKKIAQILLTWDKAISVTEKLLANSQQQKKALMQQLLTGKKRLLDENGGRFSGEWCTCTLSEVAHIIMGSSPKSEAYNDNGLGLPLIQGNADIKCRVSCPRVYTSDITKECSPGDILLSVRAPVGTVALSQHKACIGRGISAIKSKRKMSQSFLYQWFLWFEPKWCYLSQGSTFESINSDDIKTLKLSVPNFEEQQKIATVLSAADDEIATLEKKLACLKDEKKALMQQLLTGKRRVKIDEAVAA
ncbi:restriction endonuclease subunit S [Enterobacter vonholyi]|uniref:restriction endonuclease subunit S n=1 Tax=Enterobacter vonholyi TaxID=2797505 RepID=UPI0020C0C1BE|nr:restriction endonuclease subunit S [Enterobacter vonholyi]MCL5636015.1 restriction endonuclease subunit S [Enterobacter vonholyi]